MRVDHDPTSTKHAQGMEAITGLGEKIQDLEIEAGELAKQFEGNDEFQPVFLELQRHIGRLTTHAYALAEVADLTRNTRTA